MSASTVLLNLLGTAALLLWGLRMVRTGVMRAWGGELRQRLGRSLRNRFSALAAGLGITLVLQSSTATVLMTSSFAARGVVNAAPALAILLGADVGTSIVAQLYSFRIEWLPPLLILIGVTMFMVCASTRLRDIGRAGVGLGLVLLSLHLIAQTAEPLRSSPLLTAMLTALGNEPVLALLIAGLLTVLSTSSLAVVLLVISFATHGIVDLPLAFSLVLGANLGAAVTPLLATGRGEPASRRVPLGNALFRLVGVAVALPLLPFAADLLPVLGAAPARQVANFHTAFNLALAAIFIGLVDPVAKLCVRLMPDRPVEESLGKARYLDPSARESPQVAIANAARETLRMGDIIEKMLRLTLEVFRNDDRNLLREVEALDDSVDRLHESIKHYLADLDREGFDKEDARRSIEVMTFTTNLEHAGDIIDKNLMELAAKKIRHKLRFSPEGFEEIARMHARVIDNLKLALNVFVSGEPRMARQLLEEKVVFREMERTASDNHFKRLRSGKIETIETSSVHLDVVRDLKRINSHLTSVGYPILEASGHLAKTRVKQEA